MSVHDLDAARPSRIYDISSCRTVAEQIESSEIQWMSHLTAMRESFWNTHSKICKMVRPSSTTCQVADEVTDFTDDESGKVQSPPAEFDFATDGMINPPADQPQLPDPPMHFDCSMSGSISSSGGPVPPELDGVFSYLPPEARSTVCQIVHQATHNVRNKFPTLRNNVLKS